MVNRPMSTADLARDVPTMFVAWLRLLLRFALDIADCLLVVRPTDWACDIGDMEIPMVGSATIAVHVTGDVGAHAGDVPSTDTSARMSRL
ncbi:MAG: hypothetical protein ACRDU5_23390 [Mycobacterium sp.]